MTIRMLKRACVTIGLVVSMAIFGLAQGVSTGSISGTVTDPSGAVVPGATVHVDQPTTNTHYSQTASAKGSFSFPNVRPGDYILSVNAKGFPAYKQGVVVQVGQVTNLLPKLTLSATSQSVEVNAGALQTVQVDTTTATIGGVITAKQIDELPQLGRNFLDLAQLEPGVQMIDGGNFDPTKNGYAGLSVQGAEGRTTRINVDGVDITDETVGTTTMNVPDNSIQEFQVSQSSGDTSSDIGNAGQVNITTKGGTNDIHGGGFATYRSSKFAANPTFAAQKPPFKQNQDGLDIGGPMWKNHLYWFASGERQYLDESSYVDMPDFPQYNGFFSTPGDFKSGDARLDWQATSNLRLFYRFMHDDNSLIPPSVIGGTSLSPFFNEDVTNDHDAGLDWSTARLTNSFRYAHLNFANHIVAKPVAGVPNFPVNINFDTGESFGPNLLAPQHTYQIDDEYKYDGSAFFGNHTLRYGVEVNHIAVNLYAAFFAAAPAAFPTYDPTTVPAGQDPTNPMSYPPSFLLFGNGLGYFSNLATHGNPFGGVINVRKSFYITDSWKLRPNLTINYGVHFERDPGQVNTDLNRPPSLVQFSPLYAHAAPIPNNWTPTLGIVWDPTGHGTTSIRAGIGIYYQNDIWNNVMFERSQLISTSIAPGFPPAYTGNSLLAAPQANGQPGACIFLCAGSGQSVDTQSMSDLASAIVGAQAALQASYQANAPTAFGPPLGFNSGAQPGTASVGNPIFDSSYRTPYSVQMNIGIQHQLAEGVVFSANYVRNRGVHLLITQDANHVGDARYLNTNAATMAINGAATDLGAAIGATTVDTVSNMMKLIGTTPQGGTSAITAQTIFSELNNNSSGVSLGAGANSTPGSPSFAFGGMNPNYQQISTDRNGGQSDYNGLQMQLLVNRGHLLRMLHSSSLTVSYALARLNATQSDQAFSGTANDQADPLRFYGPAGYDRTSQLSIGGSFDFPLGFRFSTVNHFSTGLPVTPKLQKLGSSGSLQIFQTDWTGDGTTGDILPNSNVGAFNRSISNPAQLQATINAYNSTWAGTITPAGQALVGAGLMTSAQLQALNLAMPMVTAAVAQNQLMTDSFLDSDIEIARPLKIGDRITVTPTVQCFNCFNIGNYDPPGNVMSGLLSTGYTAGAGNGVLGSITNTTPLNQFRKFGQNTGVFAEGIPRAFQFGIRVSF